MSSGFVAGGERRFPTREEGRRAPRRLAEAMVQRDRAVDWARGVAALAMIEGHAVHAWTSGAEKQSMAYAATRLVATSPLPAFMLLAGMAVRLRIGAAEARAEQPGPLRAGIVRRGLTVLFAGYAASAAYALMDGHQGLATFLRADVLHVIGLSIVALALLCVPRDRPVDARRATQRALAIALAMTLLSPLLYRVMPSPSGVLGFLLAPFVRVPGITIFPLIPMLGWSALGFVVAHLLSRARAQHGERLAYGTAAFAGLLLAVLCELVTGAMLGATGVLDYVHPAGIPNMTGYAARGLVLIGVAPLIVSCLPAGARAVAARLGRASLVAYVFHIPFCYGALGSALRGRLTVLQCVPFVLLLALASYAAVLVVDRAGGYSRLAAVVR